MTLSTATKTSVLTVLGLAAVIFATNNQSASAKDATGNFNQPKTILLPRNHSYVTEQDHVVGRMQPGMTPVVLVKANTENSRWIVQEQARIVNSKLFKANVVFSNPKCQEFQIRVIFIPTSDVLVTFTPGKQLETLPTNHLISQEVQVKRCGVVHGFSPNHPNGILTR